MLKRERDPDLVSDRAATGAPRWKQRCMQAREADVRDEWSSAAVLSAAYAPSPPSSESSDADSLAGSTPASERSLAEPAQTALLVHSFHQGWARAFELAHFPRPVIEAPDEVLLRVLYVGLNPFDAQSVRYKFGPHVFPWVLGRDVAAVVEAVGDGVTSVRPGDRVWTCADARAARNGGYQQYTVAHEATIARTPPTMSDLQAATLGTGLVTAAVVLYWFFGLPLPVTSSPAPSPSKQWLVIYGGGAVTGIYAAQLARQAGLNVIAIAAPERAAYLASLGVSTVDRRQSNDEVVRQVVERVKQAGGTLQYALDCVGKTTATLCMEMLRQARALMQDGAHAHLIGLVGSPSPSEGIKVHKISFSTTFYGDRAWARKVVAALTPLLDRGKIVPVPAELLPDGLAGVRPGLERLQSPQAPRAKKLVVRLAETPSPDVTLLGQRCELDWNGH